MLRAAVMLGWVLTLAITALLNFIALLYQPTFVWILVPLLTLGFYASVWKRGRVIDALPLSLAALTGICLSAFIFGMSLSTGMSLGLVWGTIYFAVEVGLLLAGGTLCARLFRAAPRNA